ncbi:NLR family CARD domain-containing protein 3-like isoform X2 [Hoplias malabaricus]
MKSDNSMFIPPGLSEGGTSSDPRLQKGSEPSCVSMKRNNSIFVPTGFSGGAGADPSWRSDDQLQDQSMCGLCLHLLTDPVSMTCGHSFCRHCLSSVLDPSALSGSFQFICPQCRKMSVSNLVLVSTDQLKGSVLQRVLNGHRTNMKKKCENLFEGIKAQGQKTLLHRIYTQLYIIKGEREGVNEEHEVINMEKTPRKLLQDFPINCSDIFKPLSEEDAAVVTASGPEEQAPKRVLTKGIAGIGKTVSVQKFVLDWAEGAANQEVDLIFVLPFRGLNLIKDDQYSLHGLVCAFHPDLRDLDPEIYHQLRAVFIFDGLDESRVPLDFKQYEKVSDITVTSSVGVLMTNLIRGDLLPSALIWITSRPAAANQIPPRYIHRVTEIQGFTDPQKEEYFRKRISDQDQAQKIISHIKTMRSLHIMCHIPVFCWISATVLQRIITQSHTEIPTTLTGMYSHFLLIQTNMKKEKYEETEERDPKKLLESNRTELLKLAELAFTQLLKGNVMFYEEDLRESSIDVIEASVYSGIFTEIFREECMIHQRKVYCFVHLSFQEFLAAVFVFLCFENKNMKPLQVFNPRKWPENVQLEDLLKRAVIKAVKCENGHLDLFLRFLLGISVETNQRLLQGLLSQTHRTPNRTMDFIKKLIKGDDDGPLYTILDRSLCTERSSSLLFCLSEMNDQSLSKELQECLKSEKRSKKELTPGQCSILAYMLLNSEEELEELEPKKYNTSQEGYRRLVSAVIISRKALLTDCNLNMSSCEKIASALKSMNCQLVELDLSNNKLQESGVVLLFSGLKSSHCKLEILRLAGSNLTKGSCEALASALQSVNSSLKELDLSNNDLRDPGVEQLSSGLKSSFCKLEKLSLAICKLDKNACEYLASALQSENSSLKELDLSNNDLQDPGVEQLSEGLKCSLCKLEKLRLSGCMVTDEGCCPLASALKSNPSHLRELDLSYNNPGQSGVKLLSDLLQDPHCALEKLNGGYGGENRMKSGLKKYACDLTLDLNTVSRSLVLSEGNRKIENVSVNQPYPNHLDRFERCSQVLCEEALAGRCYWEAECCGGKCAVAVAFKGIDRIGNLPATLFGFNTNSWRLRCYKGDVCIMHNLKNIQVPVIPSGRIGVYLDWDAGTLSFFSVSLDTHTLTHLYTHYSTFREPLYAGFWVDSEDSSVILCQKE